MCHEHVKKEIVIVKKELANDHDFIDDQINAEEWKIIRFSSVDISTSILEPKESIAHIKAVNYF